MTNSSSALSTLVFPMARERRDGSADEQMALEGAQQPTPRTEAAITALAEQTRSDPRIVKRLYCEELAQLRASAAIPNFIEVIAARRVKARLKRDANAALARFSPLRRS